MASMVVVTISYDDGSKTLSEEFGCADTHPSAEVLKDLEGVMRDKWHDMGGQSRSTKINIRVRQTG